MAVQPMPTYFAPAARMSKSEIRRQSAQMAEFLPDQALFDAIPDIILVLNEQRQIVFANQALLSLARVGDIRKALGHRPGEILNCIHAAEMDAGCGTSKFCRVCGAVRAIMNSLGGAEDIQECRISLRNGDALDLRVWSSPLNIGDENYSFLVIKDIGHEKRRLMLERVFFHDLLNSAAALHGLAEVLGRAPGDQVESVSSDIILVCERLIEEIQSQKELVEAESGDLYVEHNLISTRPFLEELIAPYQDHDVGRGRLVQVAADACEIILISDRTLLRRVLVNMLKNALEACQPGQTVTLGCEETDGQVSFWVHNPGHIPSEIQLQIFQRSFSTKAPDRGLGTYSIKLLGEVYLKGKVSFTSSLEQGTIFRITLPVE